MSDEILASDARRTCEPRQYDVICCMVEQVKARIDDYPARKGERDMQRVARWIHHIGTILSDASPEGIRDYVNVVCGCSVSPGKPTPPSPTPPISPVPHPQPGPSTTDIGGALKTALDLLCNPVMQAYIIFLKGMITDARVKKAIDLVVAFCSAGKVDPQLGAAVCTLGRYMSDPTNAVSLGKAAAATVGVYSHAEVSAAVTPAIQAAAAVCMDDRYAGGLKNLVEPASRVDTSGATRATGSTSDAVETALDVTQHAIDLLNQYANDTESTGDGGVLSMLEGAIDSLPLEDLTVGFGLRQGGRDNLGIGFPPRSNLTSDDVAAGFGIGRVGPSDADKWAASRDGRGAAYWRAHEEEMARARARVAREEEAAAVRKRQRLADRDAAERRGAAIGGALGGAAGTALCGPACGTVGTLLGALYGQLAGRGA